MEAMSPSDIGMIVLEGFLSIIALGMAWTFRMRSDMPLTTQRTPAVHCPKCQWPVAALGRVTGFLNTWGMLELFIAGPPVLLWLIVKGAEFFHAIISNLGGYAG